jgi:methionyl-tRNA synthetase
VERLWRVCAEAGDLYRGHYQGLYCIGCEQFYSPAELEGGRCPEHGISPERVAEDNWFFRLSRYAGQLHDLIATGQLRIEPAGRRNEVLGFISAGLEDFSVSRSTARARGWGIPVPDDPSQVIYVWWDALGNYITALGYGSGAAQYQEWWAGSTSRIHLVGKGVLRFHAVYWPAMLLSAGERLPTGILVHDYLTIDGRKISKSSGVTIDPATLAGTYGTDAVRWWLLREVPRVGDADFTIERLIARANDELANGLGNLVNRVVSMIHRYRDGYPPHASDIAPGSEALQDAIRRAPDLIEAALANFDFRRGTAAVWAIADTANRYINHIQPWQLAKDDHGDADAAHQLDTVLATLIQAVRRLGHNLAPFLPTTAARVTWQSTATNGRLPGPQPLFERITVP